MKPMHKTKETINVDADETNEDERTERRLNWTKDEDIRLVSNFLSFSTLSLSLGKIQFHFELSVIVL
jgi:hypothetical protein